MLISLTSRAKTYFILLDFFFFFLCVDDFKAKSLTYYHSSSYTKIRKWYLYHLLLLLSLTSQSLRNLSNLFLISPTYVCEKERGAYLQVCRGECRCYDAPVAYPIVSLGHDQSFPKHGISIALEDRGLTPLLRHHPFGCLV